MDAPRGYRYTGCATGNGYEATPAERERQGAKLAAHQLRQDRLHLYGWNQDLQAFEVYAPANDGGRVLARFKAGEDRERAHTNAAACCDHYNRGNKPRQMPLI